MISKDSYFGWQQHEVTQAYFDAINTRIADATEILVTSAGLDSDQDNFYRGFIRAYNEMLNFEVDE
jgi:hypothetical protein